MIPHIDIEAEYSNCRLSCLIDTSKGNKIVMPSIQFFLYKEDMCKVVGEYESIDNPTWIFNQFVEFLERCLLDKVTEEDYIEYSKVLDIIKEYRQAKELLDMINWIKEYGVEID